MNMIAHWGFRLKNSPFYKEFQLAHRRYTNLIMGGAGGRVMTVRTD